jgi:single-strand DNA-binding protein
MSINKVILIGRLGKDPEVRTFDSGTKKASFSLATTETHKNKAGEKVEETDWHNVAAWNALADIAEKILQKGSLVFIEGKIKTRSWETPSGEKKYLTEINADHIQLLAGGRTQATQSKQSNQDVPWQ